MNRVVLVTIVFLIMIVWFSAMANACSPSPASAGGSSGPSWGWFPPIFVGGSGGWGQGGWDRGTSTSKPSSPSPSTGRSGGGTYSRRRH